MLKKKQKKKLISGKNKKKNFNMSPAENFTQSAQR